MRSKPAAVSHQKTDAPVGVTFAKQTLFLATALMGFILEFLIELPFMVLMLLHTRFAHKRRRGGASNISRFLRRRRS